MELKFLIIFGVRINHFNVTALIVAAMKGYTAIVDLLLSKQNIDINIKTILIYSFS
mgnify:CR=1 FL=1